MREIRTLAGSHPSVWILVVMSADISNVALRRVLPAGATRIVWRTMWSRGTLPAVAMFDRPPDGVPSILGEPIAPRPLSYRQKQLSRLSSLA